MPNVTNLQPSPLPELLGPYDHLIRRPGQLLCGDAVINDNLERIIHRFLFKAIADIGPVARILVLQGQPGTGKTIAAVDASLRFGWAALMLPVALLASEHEGGASSVLDDVMRSAVQFSRRSRLRVVVIMDDFDLGIMGADAKTAKTINSALLTQRIQALCDSGDYRDHLGCPIPLILTGNDFTTQRASLLRDGRAEFITHEPTLDDRRNIARALFQPQTKQQRFALDCLVRWYRHQPIAFWRGLKNDLLNDRIDALLASAGPDSARAELERAIPLDMAALTAAAHKRAANRAKSFL